MAMVRNPDLQVLVTTGYYDLATPYVDAVYTINHLGLPKALLDQVTMTSYKAGHMMYVRRADHQKLKQEIADFIRGATSPKK